MDVSGRQWLSLIDGCDEESVWLDSSRALAKDVDARLFD